MALVERLVKGSPLTHSEMDGNLVDLAAKSGSYNAAYAYSLNAITSYSGYLYKSLQNFNLNKVPGVDTSWWQLVSVDYTQLGNIPTQTLLGRSTAGTGAIESITLGSGLVLAGSVLSAPAGAGYTDEQAQDAVGGCLANTAEINLTYNDVANSISASLASGGVAFSKIASISTARLLGRSTAGTGVIEQLTLGTGLSLSGGVLSTNSGVAPSLYKADSGTAGTLTDTFRSVALGEAGLINYASDCFVAGPGTINGNPATISQAAVIGSGSILDGSSYSGVFVGTGNVVNQSEGSVVLGGSTNVIGDGTNAPQYNAILAGSTNTIASAALRSVILGGDGNTLSGSESVIAGGVGNTMTNAVCAFIAGKENVIAPASAGEGDFAFIPGGYQGTTRGLYGARARASGMRAAVGDAQEMDMVLRGTTTDAATTVKLTANGSAATTYNQLRIPTNSSAGFCARITAFKSDGTAAGKWRVEGTALRAAGNVSLAGTTTVTATSGISAALSTCVVDCVADTTNQAISVTVNGVVATTIYWVCVIEIEQAA